LEKATWGLVIFVVVLSIAAVGVHKHQSVGVTNESEIKDSYKKQKQSEPGVVAPNFGENPEAAKTPAKPGEPAKK